MDYYSKANAQIIEDLKDLPIKKQYLEGPGENPPLTNVMSHDLNDSKFFADYISKNIWGQILPFASNY